jgi:GT2 family glycosyltransferase
MKVGMPVISTNEGELLRQALPTALEQDGAEFDVVVLDNASQDSTAAVADELGVRCVRLARRHSFCEAMNAGLREVEGEVLLFMQPDTFLTPGFVATGLRRLAEPGVGSVAPKLVRTEGPRPEQRLDAIDTAGMVVDRRRKNGLVGHGRPSLAFDLPGEVFGADGAVALYRREALEQAADGDGAVFDEDLVTWGSDADLAWRVRLVGWRCVYEPAGVAYHIRTYSPSTRAAMPEWDRMMQFRNRYLMLAKNDPLPSLLRDLPRIVGWDLLALPYIVLRERCLLRGYVEAARLLPRMLRKRAPLQRRRASSTLPYGLEPPA